MFNSGMNGIIPTMNLGNNDNDGMMNGGGWWAWIIVIIALLWGRNGFGGWGNNSEGNSCCTPATVGDIQRGFDNQTTQQRFNGLDQGLCSLGYDNATLINGVNQNVSTTGFGIQNAITQMGINNMQDTNALSRQLADCCCENRQAIAQVRYDMATDTCAIQNTIQNTTRDIIDNDNANWRALNDKITDIQMQNLKDQLAEARSLNTALNLAQSQDNQTRYLVDTLRPCPTPSYITCNPWASNGTAYNGCCGNNFSSCGC